MLNENFINRSKILAGIINEDIKLVSNSGDGRSGSGTLGFYIEQYLLDLTSNILNSIKNKTGSLEVSPDSTKISENTLIVKFKIQNQEFLLTSLVSFEQNANTSVSISNGGKTEKFNLNSKHSNNDVKLFIQEILERL